MSTEDAITTYNFLEMVKERDALRVENTELRAKIARMRAHLSRAVATRSVREQFDEINKAMKELE